MAEQLGRCVNVEFCPVAVTRRIVCVAEGDSFTCARCGEPLEPAGRVQVVAGKRLAAGLQVAVVVLFGAAIAWKFAGPAATPQRVDTAAAAPTGATLGLPAVAPPAVAPPVVDAPVVDAPAAASVPDAGASVSVPSPAPPAPAVGAQADISPPAPAVVAQAETSPPAVALPGPPAVAAPVVALPVVALPVVAMPGPAPVVPALEASPVAAGAASAANAAAGPVPTTLLLRIAGSDPVAGKLASRLASGYLAMIGDAGIGVEAGGSDRVLQVFGMQAGQRELIEIATGADPSASPGRGLADVSISFRKPIGAEVGAATAGGASVGKTMTVRGSDVVMAVLGLGIVVNRSNPVTALTTDQLRGVLAGRIVNWSELRGRDAPVNLHLLDGQAGFGDIVQEMQLVPAGSTVRAAQRYATEAELAGAVADDPDGLGLVMAGNAGRARLLAIGKDGAPPVLPSNMALATEEYPLTRRLYLHPGADGTNAVARRFMEYAMSPTGQAAIEAAGFAVLPSKTERGPGAEAGPDRLRQLITGSTRVSADLHFYPGSVQLDARSVRELERLVAFLRTERVSSDRVILAGFTDSYGPPAANLAVSQRRAEVVTAALARYGITPGETIGFGSELPIGDNATPDGRERNRRVEVYLAP